MEQGNINNPESKVNDSATDDKSYGVKEASKFIEETSLDKMHEIAEAARMKKLMEPPKWVLPEDT